MSAKAAAGRVFKAIDWDKLAGIVRSETGRRELAALKRQYDDISNTIETKLSQKPVNIDWELYKKSLAPGIAEMFEKSYKSVTIPKFVDTYTPEFEKTHAKLMAEAAEQEEFSKKEVARLKEEIEKVKAQKAALATLTVDEYFAKNPDVKAKIDDEIKNQNWGY